mgnify:CR=1 FL=1
MGDELMRALGQQLRIDPLAGDDPASAELADALLPLDEDEEARLVDEMFRRLDAGELAAGAGDDDDDDLTEGEAAPAEPAHAAPVVSLAERRRSRVTAFVVVAASLAAALLVWLVMRTPQRPTDPQVAELPEYVITELHGGTAKVRAAPQDPPSAIEVASDATIDVVVAPRSPVRPPLAVVVRAVGPDGTATLVRPTETPKVSAEGVVRLQAPAASLGATSPGTWELQLLVGPPDTLPATAKAADGRGPWARVALQVTVAP